MVFIKHNSLKSDIFFNPIFVLCFSGSILFRVHVFRIQIFQGPGFAGSRFFRVRVQVLEVALFLYTCYNEIDISWTNVNFKFDPCSLFPPLNLPVRTHFGSLSNLGSFFEHKEVNCQNGQNIFYLHKNNIFCLLLSIYL